MGRHVDGPLMTMADGARAMAIDIRTLRGWIKRGDLPGLTLSIGKRVFLRRAVLERLLSGAFPLASPSASAPLRSVSDSAPAAVAVAERSADT